LWPLLGGPAAFAGPANGADLDEIPLVGRPIEFPFSEASAPFARKGDELLSPFRLEAEVSPTRVDVDQPVTLTVTVRALATVRRPPRRIDLRDVPAFARYFHIEDVTDGKKEQIASAAWRWTYRLRPRQVGLYDVPGVPFVFYNPDLRPADRAFQVLFTDPIRLTVTPAEPPIRQGDLPSSVREVASGSAVLARVSSWHGPGPVLVVVVLGLPPILCAGWYLAWRRLYPDAAYQARQRQSRAARRALAALQTAARQTGREQAEGISQVMIVYLRERFGLIPLEPTPQESALWLRRFGYNEAVTQRLRQLLEQCAAVRFGPDSAADNDLVEPVRGLIIDLEEPSCPPSS
jgi:hypothetical protein